MPVHAKVKGALIQLLPNGLRESILNLQPPADASEDYKLGYASARHQAAELAQGAQPSVDTLADELAEFIERQKASDRYPYTYAADLVRGAGFAASRSDASQWRQEQADKLGVDDDEYAKMLADVYVEANALELLAESKRANAIEKVNSLIGEPV